MRVPTLDLKPQIKANRAAIMDALESVIDSADFIMGANVQQIEAEVATYVGAKHGIGVASGSDALLIALMALGIGEGDEVITTPYTFFSTVSAICRVGATPVFVDIRPDTFNIDEQLIIKQIHRRTKAIIPVHLFGQCAEMGPINDVAAQCGVAVIEDAAQSLGAEYDGREAGSIGDIACLSFYPTKNLGGFGDGGMITTSDDELAERCRLIRAHGSRPKYYHAEIGINSRLDAIQAAILLVGIKQVERWVGMRWDHARIYSRELAGIDGLTLPATLRGQRHSFNQYVIRSDRRDRLKAFLAGAQISSEIYYPLPLHMQECFTYLGYKEGDFPEAERAAKQSLAIPMFPYLTPEQRAFVIDAIKSGGRRW
jgi:dTDP-4-amino-4,6-dideoxygalactose transaminase